MKEQQDARRDLEDIAEDRERRLAQVEQLLSDIRVQLSASEKNCAEVEAKYQFQVEVSQRVARHYNNLKRNVLTFEARYAELAASLEQSQQLFDVQEAKIVQLEAMKGQVMAAMEAKRKRSEKTEILMRQLEERSSDALAKLSASEARANELQALVEAHATQIEQLKTKLQAQANENASLVDLTKNQASLIEKDQKRLLTLAKELETIIVASSAGQQTLNAPNDELSALRAKVSLLQTQIETLEELRTESLAQHKTLLDSLTQSYHEAEEKATQSENKAKDLEIENRELRALLTKHSSTASGSYSSTRVSTTGGLASRRFESPSATATRPQSGQTQRGPPTAPRVQPSPSHPVQSRPKTTAAATSRTGTLEINSTTNSSPRKSSSARMDIDADDQDDDVIEIPSVSRGPRRFEAVSMPDLDASLDILPSVGAELFQYRGLKCCGQPAGGLTVSCTVCNELLHVQCLESQRSAKSLGKNKKFVCASCDPSLKSPRGRRSAQT